MQRTTTHSNKYQVLYVSSFSTDSSHGCLLLSHLALAAVLGLRSIRKAEPSLKSEAHTQAYHHLAHIPSAQHQKPQETRPREPTTERVLERLHASQVRRPGTDRKSCTTRDSWLPYEQMVQGASHQLAFAAHLAVLRVCGSSFLEGSINFSAEISLPLPPSLTRL
ncbi:hypothetical protein HNY73_002387 [Argiope bruennichi]|uniref:Uncharacterized protein n=1 Tax=Argiope bruennichi TaxID=94029 RepID=A0A8T0FXR6_ARGBR|nr:hypothetical protein HNY73_002387 [Argiope bruennichi]